MKKYVILIIWLMSFIKMVAQDGFKTETLKDGKVTVKSKVVTQQVGNKEKNVFYYMVETSADIDLGKAEAFMLNSENYKKFLESMGNTHEIRKVSANTWLTYIYFDNSFPVSDNDCVQRFEFAKTTTGFTITGKAAPGDYEKKEVSRIDLYDVVYRFEKLDDKKIKVSIEAVFCPASSIPKVLMNSWLPGGPAKIINRLVTEIAK